MQTYNVINNELTGAELPGKIYENLQSLKSDFSGTSFPTENLVAGMTCFRTDSNKVYRLLSDLQTWKLESDLNFEGGIPIATQAQAEEGVDNTTVMTPWRTKQFGDKNYLSLKGGILTGSLRIGQQGYNIVRTESNGYLSLAGGLNPWNGGGGLYLYGKDYVTESIKGIFELVASDGTVQKMLRGYPDGSLIWNSKKVATISDIPAIATQAEAEAGTDNSTVMTPLRTKNAIDKFAPVKSVNGKTGDVVIPEPNYPVTSVNGMTGDVTINIPTPYDGTMREIFQNSATITGNTTYTITGLTPYKLVYLVYASGTPRETWVKFKNATNIALPSTVESNSNAHYNTAGNGEYGVYSASWVDVILLPTATSCALTFGLLTSGGTMLSFKVFQ